MNVRRGAEMALLCGMTACGSSAKGFAAPDAGLVGDGGGGDPDAGTGFGEASGGRVIAPDAACATSVEPTTSLPGAVTLVIDRSFSMSQTPDGNDAKLPGDAKWDMAQPALVSLVQGLPAGLDLGLELFPDGTGCGVSPPQVPLGDIAATRAAVTSTLTGAGPFGDTPTTDALNGAYQDLLAHADVGARAVVFMSDGEPNCGSTADSVQAAVATAFKDHFIRTYVIGIPGSPDSTFSHLAIAGGTQRSPACQLSCDANPAACCHYDTTASDFQATLTAALTAIAGKLKTDCVYKLPAGQNADPTLINVLATVDGTSESLVPQSADPSADGWSYTDASHTAIVIHGALCQEILASKSSKVEILLGCPTVVN